MTEPRKTLYWISSGYPVPARIIPALPYRDECADCGESLPPLQEGFQIKDDIDGDPMVEWESMHLRCALGKQDAIAWMTEEEARAMAAARPRHALR